MSRVERFLWSVTFTGGGYISAGWMAREKILLSLMTLALVGIWMIVFCFTENGADQQSSKNNQTHDGDLVFDMEKDDGQFTNSGGE